MSQKKQNVVTTTPSLPEKLTFRKGVGYWDVTYYPYGGSFHRFLEETTVVPIERAGKYPHREYKVRLPNGNYAIVDSEHATWN